MMPLQKYLPYLFIGERNTRYCVWIFGGVKVLIGTYRVGINKGVINPLSKAEKQGLAPPDIVPPKLVAKNRIQKAGREPEIRTSGPNP
jgi:hypothetical protein